MKVVVRSHGTSPSITTTARANAPAGARALADLLSTEDFADLCTLTIDYVGDGFTPVLNIHTVKFFIEHSGRRLEHDWNLSLEDAFGLDNFDNAVAREIVQSLKEEFETKGRAGPPLYN